MIKLSIRIIGIGAMIAPLIFGALWLASALTDGQWIFGQQTLSTLGVSENIVAAALFNCACVVSGLLGILFCIFRYDYEDKINRIGSIILIIGMFLLMLVGVFTKAPETHFIHESSATTFGILMILTMILSIPSDKNHRWMQIATVLLLLSSAIATFTQELPMWEALDIIIGNIWIFLLGLKYVLYSKEYTAEGGIQSA